MRILFSFVGGRGHFEPLVPLARAAEAMGHGVAIGCHPSMAPMVETAGFGVLAIGEETGNPPERIALRPVDREREDRHLRDRFARRAARVRAPLVAALCAEWKPDVLVCDEMDFGAIVAAEEIDLPFATVLVNASGSFVRPGVVAAPLNELRVEHGLAPDPRLEMLSRYLVLSPFPPSFRDPSVPLPTTTHSFRPTRVGSDDGPASAAPGWSSVRPGAPVVYFTLGTVFNLESGDLLARVLAGLRELPVNVVVTIGDQIDPIELGARPAHVHIASHIPQSRVLPHCDVVVSHGGSGSVIGALAHGLPSVLIPLGADQPLNAERCEQLRVAQTLDAVEATSDDIRTAVGAVLRDPVYRRNAERLRDEIAALPEPAHAIGLLERLSVEKRPQRSV